MMSSHDIDDSGDWLDQIYEAEQDPFEAFQAAGITVISAVRIELFHHALVRRNSALARSTFEQLTPADKDVIRYEIASPSKPRDWSRLLDALDGGDVTQFRTELYSAS